MKPATGTSVDTAIVIDPYDAHGRVSACDVVDDLRAENAHTYTCVPTRKSPQHAEMRDRGGRHGRASTQASQRSVSSRRPEILDLGGIRGDMPSTRTRESR